MQDQTSDRAACDLAAVSETFNGNPHQVDQFIQIWMEHTPVSMKALVLAIRRRDPDDVVSAAHSVRGSAAMIGAVGMKKLAASVEACGHACDVSGAKSAYPKLKREWRAVYEHLKQRRLQPHQNASPHNRPFAGAKGER